MITSENGKALFSAFFFFPLLPSSSDFQTFQASFFLSLDF